MATSTAREAKSGTSEAKPRSSDTFSLKDFGKELYAEFQDDRVTGLAKEVAYNLMFSIPPLLILVVILAALLNQVTSVPVVETLRDTIANNAPGSAQEILNQLVDNAIAQVGAGALSIGLIVALALAIYGGSGAIGAFVDAFNIAYEVDEGRPFLKKQLARIGLTLLIGVGTILAFVLFVFGHRIGQWIADLVGLGSLFTTLWDVLRWPIAALIILVLLAVLYYLGPNVEQSFRWISPGSIVATILWIVAIFGFKLYLTLSNPGSAYGAAGGVIVLLYFLYITGIIFILGAEINSILERRHDPETIKDLAQHPEKTTPQQHQASNRRARQKGLPASDQGQAQPQGQSDWERERPNHAMAIASEPREQSDQSTVKKASWAMAAAMVVGAFVLDKVRGNKERQPS